ncbi:hypothetical protein DSO57_1019977 [Entomophthora muscae]|nr:hypothetical protein DSO57_1019977 [Entomophthora muscae]
MYGKSRNSICWLKDGVAYRSEFRFFLLYITTYPGAVYCLVIAMCVFMKRSCLMSQANIFGLSFVNSYPSPLLHGFASRIALYPLSLFISQVGYMVMGIHLDITKKFSFVLFAIALLLQSTTGIANLICFCFDPVFSSLFNKPANPEAPDHIPTTATISSATITIAQPATNASFFEEQDPKLDLQLQEQAAQEAKTLALFIDHL